MVPIMIIRILWSNEKHLNCDNIDDHLGRVGLHQRPAQGRSRLTSPENRYKNDDYDYEEDDDVGEEDGEDGLEEEYGGDDE